MQNLTYVLYLSTLLKIKCHINTFLSWLRLCQCIFRFFLSCCSKNGFHSIAKIRKEIQPKKKRKLLNSHFLPEFFEHLIAHLRLDNSMSFKCFLFLQFLIPIFVLVIWLGIFFYKTRVCLYVCFWGFFCFFHSTKIIIFWFWYKNKNSPHFKLFDHKFWAG